MYTELVVIRWSHIRVDDYVKLSRFSRQAGVFGRGWFGGGSTS